MKEDNINKKYFLLPYLENNVSVNDNIYIVQFPQGNLSHSKGKIITINNYEIEYDDNTRSGSSGSPIFLENTTRVIGIHKAGSAFERKNFGDLIFPILQDLDEIFTHTQINYDDGAYYIGECKDIFCHGKGIIYAQDGKMIYEGDFKDDKYEGNGKLYFEDGGYFIGEMKEGHKYKGKEYYENGNIEYEGDFKNDKYEGNGKLYFEEGGYYIGEFKGDI